jgi:hypothetical protein
LLTKSSGIETGLLRMQSEILLAFRSLRQKIAENRGQGSCNPIGEMDPASCREILTGNGAQDCIADARDGASRSRDIRSAICVLPISIMGSSTGSLGMRAVYGDRLCRRCSHCRPSNADEKSRLSIGVVLVFARAQPPKA